MRDWRVRRVLQPHPDGQRHWDRTYQQLMAWTHAGPQCAALPADPAPPAQEVNDEDRDLCTGVHSAPGPGGWPRPAIGAPAGSCTPARMDASRPRTSSAMTATAAPRSSGLVWSGCATAWPCGNSIGILITAPDRLARNYVHQVLLLEEITATGCQVHFLDRPMSQDPHDQLLLQIRGAVAEYERSLIAERMRRGRLRKLQAGDPVAVDPGAVRLSRRSGSPPRSRRRASGRSRGRCGGRDVRLVC